MGRKKQMRAAALMLVFILTAGCAGDSALVRSGRDRLRYHDRRGAEQAFRKAIRRNGAASAGNLEQARLCLATGRTGEARLLLHTHARHGKATPGWWVLSVRTAMNEQNNRLAAYLLHRGLTRFPGNASLRKLRREYEVQTLTGRILAASRNYPGKTDLLKTAAFSLLHLGYEHSAGKLFAEIIKKDPDNRNLLERLSRYHLAKNNRKQATFFLEKLLNADGRNRLALETLAKTALDQGYIWKAYRLYYANASSHPETGSAWEQLGYITLRLGKKDKAAEYLKKALQLGIKNYRIYSRLGYLLLSDNSSSSEGQTYLNLAEGYRPGPDAKLLYRRRLEQKITGLKQFLAFFNNTPDKLHPLHYRLALNYKELGRWNDALQHILAASAQLPANPRYMFLQAEIRLQLEQYARTKQLIDKLTAVRYRPISVHLLASRLHATGPFRSAKKRLHHLMAGYRLAPERAGICKLIGDWYLQHNRKKTALNWYNRAVTLGAPLQKLTAGISKELQTAALIRQSKSARSWKEHFIISRKFSELQGAGSLLSCKHMEAAAGLRPDNAWLQICAGEAYANGFFRRVRWQDLATARNYLQKGLQLDPHNRFALESLSKLKAFDLSATNDAVSAINHWARKDRLTSRLAIANNRDLFSAENTALAQSYFQLGKIMQRSSQDAKASEFLKKSIALSPAPSMEQQLALAATLRENGDYLGAAAAYRDLATRRDLPDSQQYALLKLAAGNMYALAASTYPANLTDYSNCVGTNRYFNLQSAQAAAVKINSWKNTAIAYYRLYVDANQFYTQKQMGRNKISEIAKLSPTAETVILRAAALLRHNGAVQQAEQMLQANIRSIPDPEKRKPLYTALAGIYSLRNDNQSLNRLYGELVKAYPNDWRSFNSFGNFLLRRGQLNRSIKAFEQSSSLMANNSDTKTVLGFLYWKTGDYRNSLIRLQDAIRINENSLSALYILMQVLLNKGDSQAAYNTGSKLIRIFKEDLPGNIGKPEMKAVFLDTLSVMAHLSFAQGERSSALKILYEGIQFDPEDTHKFLTLAGDIYYMDKKYLLAEQYYKKAVQKHADNQFYNYKLAAAMLKTGKEFQGLQIMQQLSAPQKLFPQKDDMLLLYGKTLLAANRFREGVKILQQMISSFPHNQHGYLSLARHYLKTNRLESARRILERGTIAANPAPEIRDALVWLLLEHTGELNRAYTLARNNAELHPGNSTYRATLSYVRFKLQQKSRRNSQDNGSAALQLPAKTDYDKQVFAEARLDRAVQLSAIGKFDEALQNCSPVWNSIKKRGAQKISPVSELLFTRNSSATRLN